MGSIMTIFSFDPGKVTGAAWGDDLGNLSDYCQFTISELYDFLNVIRSPKVFIIEDFNIRPNKAASFAWSDMEVIQVIGALKYAAYSNSTVVVMQKPTVKTSGYRWAGIVPPKKHSESHATDAYAHLVYYWVQTLKLEAPVIKQMRLNNNG